MLFVFSFPSVNMLSGKDTSILHEETTFSIITMMIVKMKGNGFLFTWKYASFQIQVTTIPDPQESSVVNISIESSANTGPVILSSIIPVKVQIHSIINPLLYAIPQAATCRSS